MDKLEEQLELFIENARTLGIIVSDFQPQSQAVLNQKINQLVTTLDTINRTKDQANDVQIPVEVFDYIDQGRNPQLYTKDCMERSLLANEQVKGKIESYKRFKSLLVGELSKSFPKEMDRYKERRGDDSRPAT